MDTPRADSVGGVPQGPHEVLLRVHQCALCVPGGAEPTLLLPHETLVVDDC